MPERAARRAERFGAVLLRLVHSISTMRLVGCLLAVTVLSLTLDLTYTQDLDDVLDDITIETVDDDIPYQSPNPKDPSKVYFHEHFDDPEQFAKRWTRSQAKKDGIEEDIAKYDGEWAIEQPQKDGLAGDRGLVLKSKAKHAAIASSLHKPFVFNQKPLIVQYEVVLQEGQECGGAYLKLLSEPSQRDLKQFTDKTPYSIMFGPDKCGNDYKLHFIFRHRNPLNGTIEEKHCQKPKERLEEIYDDKLPHLYTLILNPDNTFEIKIDQKTVNSGSLLEDFVPPVNPPAEIEDPSDVKPADWDEREKIPDPEATKPEDWDEDAPAQIVDEAATMPEGWLVDEPTHIPDPAAQKPADWDADMDGEWEPALIENPACSAAPGCGAWEPPLINNPDFRGKWRAPFIDNPNYKGKWRPRTIPNPDYFEDKTPFRLPTVNAVGFELWSMSKDILFDNIIITEELVVAEQWAADTFAKKRQKIAKDSESVIQKLAVLTNEYPALWAVYILVLAIPVVFVLYLCFKPSSATSSGGTPSSQTKMEQEELRQAAEKKKTDAETEGDQQQVPEEAEADERAGGDDEEEDDDEDAEKYSNPDSDDDNEAVEDEQGEEQQERAKSEGPRKRKARKE